MNQSKGASFEEAETVKKTWTARHTVLLTMIFLAFVLGYIDRINISVVVPVWVRDFHMDPEHVGFLVGIFGWTYIVGLLGAGLLCDRYNPRIVVAWGVALWSVATVMTGFGTDPLQIGFARGLLGLGEGTLIPAAARIVTEAFDPRHRTRVVASYFSGAQLGLAVGGPLAVAILATAGWQSVFFATAGLGVAWVAGWYTVHANDYVMPHDTQADAGRASGAAPQAPSAKAGLRQLLRSRTTWALMLGQFGFLYLFYTFVSWLPGYLVLARHMALIKSGFLATAPFVINAVMGLASGYLADVLIRRGYNRVRVRKVLISFGLIGCTAFTMLAAEAKTAEAAVVFLFCAIGILGFAVSSINVLPMDVASPDRVASLTGLQNFAGNIGGAALAPTVTGAVYARTGSFEAALLLAAAIALICGVGGIAFLLPGERKLEKNPRANTAGS